MRCAVVFGQFGGAADPVNLPHFRSRLAQAGIEAVMFQHMDSQKVYDFLKGETHAAIVGASLGAGAAPVMAGYLKPRVIKFIGGFQPSAWDPVMAHSADPPFVSVPDNVLEALCFRNSNYAMTAGLGYATWVRPSANKITKLEVIDRPDIHPGDFGPAQDIMVQRVVEALK